MSKPRKPIVLRYSVNGARFKTKFPVTEYKAAQTRADVLRENGIEVKIQNMPKRIEVNT